MYTEGLAAKEDLYTRFVHKLVLLVLFSAFPAMGETNVPAYAPQEYTWTCVSSSAPWTPRNGHASVTFGNKMWILGGYELLENYTYFNDVWCSEDGSAWECVTEHADWSPRMNHAVAVFQNKMWLFGGYSDADGDIWCSSDGANWTLVSADAPWTRREGHTVVVFRDQLWLIGGHGYSITAGGEVWRSSDGHEWSLVTQSPPWTPRELHTSCTFDGKLWIIGGVDYREESSWRELNDVWFSTDGVEWKQATTSSAWSPRYWHVVSLFQDDLWLLGGEEVVGSGPNAVTIQHNDVWRSHDGVNWSEVTNAAWPARSGHTNIVFNNRLWTMGGFVHGDPFWVNDIWYFPPPQFSISSVHAPWYQVGEALNLQVTATGLVGTPDYQWYKDGVSLGGETTVTYHVDTVALADAGSYTCQVLDSAKGIYTAGPLLITVVPAGALPAPGPLALLTAAAIAALTVRKRCRG